MIENYDKAPNAPIWRIYRYDMTKSRDVARFIARHPYAWPGGYPTYAITDDGGALCPACCATEYARIAHAIPGDGFFTVAREVNYENPDLHCDHCGQQIECAYCE